MAKSPQRPGRPRPFAITNITPGEGATATIQSDGTILITISADSLLSINVTILAYSPPPGSGLGASISSGPASETPTGSGNYTIRLNPGTVNPDPAAGVNNRVLQVIDSSDGIINGYPFRAAHGGSGSGSSGSGSNKFSAAARSPYFRKDQPVPVAVTLKVDSPVTAGSSNKIDALNKPTRLLHSQDASHPASWFSQPIQLGDKGSPAAHWALEKADDKTWLAVLRQADKVIVTYRLKTKDAKDGTFPLHLKRKGDGGKQFKDWPKTITVSPAT